MMLMYELYGSMIDEKFTADFFSGLGEKSSKELYGSMIDEKFTADFFLG